MKFASRACSRPTHTPTISRATAASRSTTAPGSGSTRRPSRIRARAARRRRRGRVGAVSIRDDPHARAPARALLVRRQRSHRERRAVARAHRRLAVRRRRGAARPRDRGARRRARASSTRCAGWRSCPTASRCTRVTSPAPSAARDELEGVVDDRLRAPLQPRAPIDERGCVRRRLGRGSQLRPPNMERIVALNRGPFLGAPAPVERLDDPGDAVVLDVRPLAAYLAGHAHGAINVPVDGSRFSTKAGSCSCPTRRSSSARRPRTRRSAPYAGCAPSASSTSPATCSTADDERLAPIELDEVERADGRRRRRGARRARAGRARGGYIAGSRNVPYRLVRRAATCFGEKPIVTVCETGRARRSRRARSPTRGSTRARSSTAASPSGRSATPSRSAAADATARLDAAARQRLGPVSRAYGRADRAEERERRLRRASASRARPSAASRSAAAQARRGLRGTASRARPVDLRRARRSRRSAASPRRRPAHARLRASRVGPRASSLAPAVRPRGVPSRNRSAQLKYCLGSGSSPREVEPRGSAFVELEQEAARSRERGEARACGPYQSGLRSTGAHQRPSPALARRAPPAICARRIHCASM